MNRRFRVIAIITRNEIADSVRSRRVIAMVILYLIGAAAATALFISFLHAIETKLMQANGAGESRPPGMTMAALWQSDSFRNTVTRLLGDRHLAQSLLEVPPLGLFYGWLALTFTPVLVVLMSATRVAEEVAAGSVRYVLVRAARSHWCLGKFVGQALQVLVALLLSAACTWMVGLCCLSDFQPVATAGSMLLFALKAWIYALPFLGLALGVSQVCTSPNLALVFGFVSLVALSILSSVTGWLAGPGWRGIWDLVHTLTPGGHKGDLWWNDMSHLFPAVAFLLALAAGYSLVGYARFSRRDL